ncbi:hypothetical protein D3C76_1483790 [compost metagenome]
MGSRANAAEDYISMLIPDHKLNAFEYNQLDYTIRMALNCPSYAELSRRLYGDAVGKNPAQKSRSYLFGYGLTLAIIKEKLQALRD